MRWKNSLAIPIVVLMLMMAIGMLLIGYVINSRVFYSVIEEREKDKANSIWFGTRSLIDAEIVKLSTLSNLLKADRGITAGLVHHERTRGDILPLKAAMDDIFWQIDTRIFVVTDPGGTVLYRADEPLRRGEPYPAWGIEDAAAGTPIIEAAEGPRGWTINSISPVRSGKRIVGLVILGIRLDDAFARKISRETGAGIAFANLNGVLTGFSSRAEKPPYDQSVIREVLLKSFPILRMDLDRFKAIHYIPLKVVDETFCMIIETDLGSVRSMLHRNRIALAKTAVLIFAAILLLGAAGTYFLLRPLKELEREARKVVREFTGEELPAGGEGNEIKTLSTANRRMVEAITEHISRREKAETALRQSEEQRRQAQKMEAIGRLAGGVAHDFNNLLTVINGYSEVLLRRFRESDPARREIDEIRKAGERAAVLTRQLLAFSRKQILEQKPILLNEVVSGMHAMLRRLIGENIEISMTLHPDGWTVVADPGQVEQVIMNLVVNARDAMPSGGSVTLSTENVEFDAPTDHGGFVVPAGRYVRLGVSDTGHGMDPETMSHMFEPFFTTKARGKGTGLGLASVYGIVKQSGGYILVRSEPARGTSFELYLPAVEARTAQPEAEGVPQGNFPVADPAKETILVVEDEEIVRTLVTAGLRKFGYTILPATGGADALAIAERHAGPIDLLLTDVVMPGMNGMDLADRLLAARPGIKVFFISGYSEEGIGKFGVMGEGAAFLQKPITPDQLARKVREHLDSRSGQGPHLPPPRG